MTGTKPLKVQFEDRKGKQHVALAVRSELDLSAQIDAPGVTWLDRRNLARDLLAKLERGDIEREVEKLAREVGLPHHQPMPGEYVMGTVRERISLASGRYAMIDDGLGFSLVPWTPSLDNRIGKHITGVMRDDGRVDWSFARKRGLGL